MGKIKVWRTDAHIFTWLVYACGCGRRKLRACFMSWTYYTVQIWNWYTQGLHSCGQIKVWLTHGCTDERGGRKWGTCFISWTDYTVQIWKIIRHGTQVVGKIKVWRTDTRTDWRTDGWHSYNPPFCFANGGGQLQGMWICIQVTWMYVKIKT
jgi:hypothetical protein